MPGPPDLVIFVDKNLLLLNYPLRMPWGNECGSSAASYIKNQEVNRSLGLYSLEHIHVHE